jgi:hypothetical protein
MPIRGNSRGCTDFLSDAVQPNFLSLTPYAHDQGGGKGNTALKPLKLSVEEKKALKVFLVEGLAGEEVPFKYPKLP